MSRLLLIVSACALCITMHAQSWCPPGATWTYGTDAFGLFGYQQYAYVGDSILGGLNAHHVTGQGVMSYFGQSQVDPWIDSVGFFTAIDGDVIVIWSMAELDWDTLFWLGAAPGDGWLRRHGAYGPCDPQDSLVVVDTSTVVLDGLPLRRWTVHQRWAGSTTGGLYFTERLGWDWWTEPFPACLIVDGPSGMRCYSDQDISVNLASYGCETLVGIGPERDDRMPILFPNPGMDHFAMVLPPGIHEVMVFDLFGRPVKRFTVGGGRIDVEASALAPGAYVVLVDGVDAVRWVKQ